MDNMDDSENNTKISDSAYSTSCSHSQSRRSRRSKSTHSGSHSSGSSGYGAVTSNTSENKNVQPENKDQEPKKKKQLQSVSVEEEVVASEELCRAPEPEPADSEQLSKAEDKPSLTPQNVDDEKMDIETSHHGSCKGELIVQPSSSHYDKTYYSTAAGDIEGFACVVSMHDGVVMYTTASHMAVLGYPKNMWVGRSFIDFVHPKDHSTFASQITNGLAGPKVVNGTLTKELNPVATESTMACRIRCYRNLTAGFGVKGRLVTYIPFMLKFTFKCLNEEEDPKLTTYLVIQASPFTSAFKVPCENLSTEVSFVIRHSASGSIDYIGDEAIPYLGYMPQDLKDMNALKLYHDEDLPYLRDVYEKIVKEGTVSRSAPYRMKVQNGGYLTLETEWSSFINPWSNKLEFVIGKHWITEGPANPNVFNTPIPANNTQKMYHRDIANSIAADRVRETMIKIMNEVLTKPAVMAKQCLSKRCQDLAVTMESLIADPSKNEEDQRPGMNDRENSCNERDFVMLGGISPHHDNNDSKSSTETPLTYNQLNYKENLQRYFDSAKSHYNEADNADNVGVSYDPNKIGAIMPPVIDMTQDSADSFHLSSCGSSKSMSVDDGSHCSSSYKALAKRSDYNTVRLTENSLIKHNNEMKRELLKMRREMRARSKEDREKENNERKQKKKDHLARCNASFNPTLNLPAPTQDYSMPFCEQPTHSLKRANSNDDEAENMSPLRKTRRRSHDTPPFVQQHKPSTSCERQFHAEVGPPSLVHGLNAEPGEDGTIPTYYTPVSGENVASCSRNTSFPAPHTSQQFANPPTACAIYGGHAVYGHPFMYSRFNPLGYIGSHPGKVPQHHNQDSNGVLYPLNLTRENYDEACKLIPPLKPSTEKHLKSRPVKEPSVMLQRFTMDTPALHRSAEARVDQFAMYSYPKENRSSDDTQDRTDGESSYSSFYSSFFKTDSGSADDSGDQKRRRGNAYLSSGSDNTESRPRLHPTKKAMPRTKMEPPWMINVCMSADLIYKYQVVQKTIEDVLAADKEKINFLPQYMPPSSSLSLTPSPSPSPSFRVHNATSDVVNDQLGQLYQDLSIEEGTSMLNSEERMSSSSSSGEESQSDTTKVRRKRCYSKLVMIYEEDVALPSPQCDENSQGECEESPHSSDLAVAGPSTCDTSNYFAGLFSSSTA